MPSSDSGDNRKPFKPHNPGAPPPPEQEHLPCPRCDSTNTKFCYYNNYNLSQPRHFCKSCRRYWTHGGTLRDIPVGGGTRKNAKRSRTATFTTIASSATSAAVSGQDPLLSTPVLVPLQGSSVQFGGGDMKGGVNVCGSFTSLLNTQGHGFLALSGFGLGLGSGLGHGFDEMGFGIGRGVWPFPGVGDGHGGVTANGGGGGGGVGVMGNTWQSFESGEGEFVGGDCFSLPDLAISTPGNGLK